MAVARWIRGESIFTEWKERWQHLADNAPNSTPFQTWEWQVTWFAKLGKSQEPLALAVMEGDDLVGWLPCVISQGPWRTLRPMGIGVSDYLHPLAQIPLAAEFDEALLQAPEVDLVDLHQLREDLSTIRIAEPLPQATCLVRELPDTYEAFLSSLGKSLRFDVRRLQKPPFSSGEAVIEHRNSGQDGALETFVGLHAKRWRGRFQPGVFPSRIQRFHRAWSSLAAPKKLMEILTLKSNGHPAGAIYLLHHRDTTYFYQAGMDAEFRSLSPGSLLVAEAIRAAIEAGKTRFDFLRGDEPYKRRWQPQLTLTNFRQLSSTTPHRGRAGVRWNRYAAAKEEALRRRFEGRALFGSKK